LLTFRFYAENPRCSKIIKDAHTLLLEKISMIGANPTNTATKNEPETPCLALRPREAAKALGISERLLWEWTDRGIVPCVRMGKAILYPVDSLRDWLKRQAQQGMVTNSEK
jgi:excisionase family DNA binding protein